MPDTLELSLAEKVHKACVMANRIADKVDAGYDLKQHGEEFVDEVYGHADGLTADYFDRIINGRCNIKAMVEFDIGQAEVKVDEFITKATTILEEANHERGYEKIPGSSD